MGLTLSTFEFQTKPDSSRESEEASSFFTTFLKAVDIFTKVQSNFPHHSLQPALVTGSFFFCVFEAG